MKALVINLDKATDRMAFQSKQLNKFHIDFQRIPAVLINRNDKTGTYQKLHKKWLRPLRASEIGAFLSHQKAWKEIVTQNQPMLIMEDDAYLTGNISRILKDLEKMTDMEYVNLEVTGSNGKRLVGKTVSHQICDASLYRLYQGRSGAGGYILWPAGAKKLLDRAKKGRIGLADKFINATYSILAYQLEPAVLIQLDQCHYHGVIPPIEVKTSISAYPIPKPSFIKYFVYRNRRMVAEMKVVSNYLRHKNKAKKRHIVLSSEFTKLLD